MSYFISACHTSFKYSAENITPRQERTQRTQGFAEFTNHRYCPFQLRMPWTEPREEKCVTKIQINTKIKLSGDERRATGRLPVASTENIPKLCVEYHLPLPQIPTHVQTRLACPKVDLADGLPCEPFEQVSQAVHTDWELSMMARNCLGPQKVLTCERENGRGRLSFPWTHFRVPRRCFFFFFFLATRRAWRLGGFVTSECRKGGGWSRWRGDKSGLVY